MLWKKSEIKRAVVNKKSMRAEMSLKHFFKIK